MAKPWEGEAPAEPIEWNMGQGTWDTGKIWITGRFALPDLQTPNKFGAKKFRHQPLAEASGMVC